MRRFRFSSTDSLCNKEPKMSRRDWVVSWKLSWPIYIQADQTIPRLMVESKAYRRRRERVWMSKCKKISRSKKKGMPWTKREWKVDKDSSFSSIIGRLTPTKIPRYTICNTRNGTEAKILNQILLYADRVTDLEKEQLNSVWRILRRVDEYSSWLPIWQHPVRLVDLQIFYVFRSHLYPFPHPLIPRRPTWSSTSTFLWSDCAV